MIWSGLRTHCSYSSRSPRQFYDPINSSIFCCFRLTGKCCFLSPRNPDRTFHNFSASKLTDRRLRTLWNSSFGRLRGSRILKCLARLQTEKKYKRLARSCSLGVEIARVVWWVFAEKYFGAHPFSFLSFCLSSDERLWKYEFNGFIFCISHPLAAGGWEEFQTRARDKIYRCPLHCSCGIFWRYVIKTKFSLKYYIIILILCTGCS